MNYDINFVLPISASKDIYLQRINDFKKFGLMNIKNHKVLVTLLVGTEKINDLMLNWPENVDVEVEECQFNDVVQKVYYYFSNLKKAKAKWTAKIDDDSLNDVAGLINNLNKNFSGKEAYICCFLNKIDYHLENEKRILKELNLEEWITFPNITLWHEWEASFLEDIVLNKILSNEKSIYLLKERSKFPRGVTDACLAFAARIAGIHPIDSYFTTHLPLISQFSIFGGNFNHIHFISRIHGGLTNGEKGGDTAFEFMRRMIEKDYDENLYNNFVNQEFLFLTSKPEGIFKFNENGKVSGNLHENESLWLVKDNKFYFLNMRGVETGSFDVVDGKLINGKSLINGVPLFLRRVI